MRLKAFFGGSIIAAMFNLSTLQAQEQDAVFMGFGLGFGGGGVEVLARSLKDAIGTKNNTSRNFANYDLRVGYKSFVNEWFGFRGYFSVAHSNSTDVASGDVSNSRLTTDWVDYYGNFDLLFNVHTMETFNVGLFAGAGLGGVELFYRGQISNGSLNGRSFQMNLKTGVRLNMQDHSVEFVAKFPLFGPKINTLEENGVITMNFRQDYALCMTYIYNFALE